MYFFCNKKLILKVNLKFYKYIFKISMFIVKGCEFASPVVVVF